MARDLARRLAADQQVGLRTQGVAFLFPAEGREPLLCRGQNERAIHMGLGYALTEELPCEDCVPVAFKLRERSVLGASDMPRTKGILVEEPEGPFGAKGVGEIGLVPTAAAVVGALSPLTASGEPRCR
jgi:CO/xanthine dehydrogenase Mo-binding subunit